MTRFATTATALLAAGAANAHPGHVGPLAGHDHWLALAAIAAALVIGGGVILRSRRKAANRPSEDRQDS